MRGLLIRVFDPDRGWRLHPQVAVRPEPFGALLYHFGTRQLSFLKSPALLAVVRGLATEPSARVTLQGEPVKLRSDGTFTMRFSLPDGRQIIPAVANSADGVEERTIVLAVERNTKQLEPMIHDMNGEA